MPTAQLSVLFYISIVGLQRAACGAHHNNVTERFCGWLFWCFTFFFLKKRSKQLKTAKMNLYQNKVLQN